MSTPTHPRQPPPSLVSTAAPQRIKIGTVTLSINPQSVREEQPAQVQYLPALAGAIRQDYGDGPHTWTIPGHTGHGGKAALLALYALRQRKGQQAKPVPFLYPWKYGAHVFRVYVDDCTWSEDMSDGGFLFNYQLLLREAVSQSAGPPIVKLVAQPTFPTFRLFITGGTFRAGQ